MQKESKTFLRNLLEQNGPSGFEEDTQACWSKRTAKYADRVERDIQVQTYQQTLQTAFREVADALAVRSTLDRRIAAQQALTDASRKSFELSDALYRGGSKSYLEALDAQRSLYSAQQDLITLRLTEQSNRITLYKVLGGGWN